MNKLVKHLRDLCLNYLKLDVFQFRKQCFLRGVQLLFNEYNLRLNLMEKKQLQSTITVWKQQQTRKIQLPFVPEINLSSPLKQSVTNIECRICLQQNDEEGSELISPCNCTGSVKYIHSSCFKKWIHKKYEDPIIREQITSHIGLKCQICKEKYQFTYSIQRKCTTFPIFCKKLKNNKLFLFGNIIFVIIDIILLAVASNYANQDIQSSDFDITQPRYFLTYIAILFASGSFIYGLYEFISLFLIQQKFALYPENKQTKSSQSTKAKSTHKLNPHIQGQQETNLRVVDPNR